MGIIKHHKCNRSNLLKIVNVPQKLCKEYISLISKLANYFCKELYQKNINKFTFMKACVQTAQKFTKSTCVLKFIEINDGALWPTPKRYTT